MRWTLLAVFAAATVACSGPSPRSRLPTLVVEESFLEPGDQAVVLAQLPVLLACMRARRPSTTCGFEEDYLEYFEPDRIDALFGLDHVSLMDYESVPGQPETLEVTMEPRGDVRTASGVIIFERRSGRWRPVDAAALIVD